MNHDKVLRLVGIEIFGMHYSITCRGKVCVPDDAAIARDADLRRLVACWNACIGQSTESLEADFSQGYQPWGHVILLGEEREKLLGKIRDLEASYREASGRAQSLQLQLDQMLVAEARHAKHVGITPSLASLDALHNRIKKNNQRSEWLLTGNNNERVFKEWLDSENVDDFNTIIDRLMAADAASTKAEG